MRTPGTEREWRIAHHIDTKGQAALEAGEPWRNGLILFATVYEDLTKVEHQFIDERLSEWQTRIAAANGQATTE